MSDAAIYHEVPQWGTMVDGGSPIWVGKELRDRYPGRMEVVGAVSPWHKDPLEEIDRLVEEDKVVGLKLYPLDIIDGVPHSYRMDDEKVIFPILERAQQRGGRISGVSSGFSDIDSLLGGLQPSDLLILAGRPGSGKTALLGKMLTLLRPQTRVAARSWKTCPTTALKPRCGIS